MRSQQKTPSEPDMCVVTRPHRNAALVSGPTWNSLSHNLFLDKFSLPSVHRLEVDTTNRRFSGRRSSKAFLRRILAIIKWDHLASSFKIAAAAPDCGRENRFYKVLNDHPRSLIFAVTPSDMTWKSIVKISTDQAGWLVGGPSIATKTVRQAQFANFLIDRV